MICVRILVYTGGICSDFLLSCLEALEDSLSILHVFVYNQLESRSDTTTKEQDLCQL